MRVVYPAILATYETLGAASLKAISGLGNLVGAGNGREVFTSPATYIVLVTWLFCVLSTLYWLRKVYAKFRTTEGLPTEIGLTTFLSILFALLFYQERHFLGTSNLALLVLCSCGILVGIGVMINTTKVVTQEEVEPQHHARRYTLARKFPAKKVWARSISQVIEANRVLRTASMEAAELRMPKAGIVLPPVALQGGSKNKVFPKQHLPKSVGVTAAETKTIGGNSATISTGMPKTTSLGTPVILLGTEDASSARKSNLPTTQRSS